MIESEQTRRDTTDAPLETNDLPRIVIRFAHDGNDYIVTYGRFPDGKPSEIFIDGPIPFFTSARMASLALQHGASIEAVRGTLIGSGGPLAKALDRVIAACQSQEKNHGDER